MLLFKNYLLYFMFELALLKGWRSSFQYFRNDKLQKITIVNVRAFVDLKQLNVSIHFFCCFPHCVFFRHYRAIFTQLNTTQHHHDIKLDGMIPNCINYITYSSLYCGRKKHSGGNNRRGVSKR